VLHAGEGDGGTGASILLRAGAARRFHHDGWHGHGLLCAGEG
jgi:hypothetical protein